MIAAYKYVVKIYVSNRHFPLIVLCTHLAPVVRRVWFELYFDTLFTHVRLNALRYEL